MANSGASFSSCSLPALPKPSLPLATAMVVMDWRCISAKILRAAKLSFCGVLNT